MDRRWTSQNGLCFAPGPLERQLSSLMDLLLTDLATGFLSADTLQVGPTIIPITQIETLAAPVLREMTVSTCLFPIVAALPLRGLFQSAEEVSHLITAEEYTALVGQK